MAGFQTVVAGRRRTVLTALLSAVMLTAGLAQVGPPVGPAGSRQPPDRARGLTERASERIRTLQQEADALARQERTLLGDLRRLELERDTRAEELVAIEQSLRALRLEQEQVAARRTVLEEQAARQRPRLNTRLVELYKLGRAGYLRLLLGVEDLRHAGRAYRAITHIAHADRARAEAYQTTIRELQATERILADRQASLAALQAEAGRARAAATEAVARRNALITDIDQQRDLMATYIGELESAQEKLRALMAARPAGNSGGEGAAAPEIALPLAPFRGALDWPAAGRPTGRFGTQPNARFGTSTYRSGIGIAAPAGSPARAVHDGVVAFAEPFTGFGNLVILDHGHNAFSLYGHLASVLVSRGAHVVAGQAVGTVGLAPMGNSELYFELRIDGRPVDPVQWLQRQ